ncbi:MAG: hypothetical protein JNM78_05595 [Cyclobacteriaceae bacterium]|nr:hypothetical protein [Cyclobacteriaceae bacterium]
MPLRYNKILKLFAILIFSFELLAPVGLSASQNGTFEDSSLNNRSSVRESTQSVDSLSQLIFEEVGSEEREDKNECLISVCFVEVFSELQKFEPVHIAGSLPKDQFDTQPPLFTLHRVLLI